jgi:hypothetical protein
VVTAEDADGRSFVEFDGEATLRSERPGGGVVVELWRTDGVPASVATADPSAGSGAPVQPPRGLAVKLSIVPPDANFDEEARQAYAETMAAQYGDEASGVATARDPGMHRTKTIDVMTVLDGELYLVTDAGETFLRAGDTVVQRGTWHAWVNRSDRPVTVVSTMVAAHS